MKKNTLGKTINGFLKNMHNSISYLNGSKIFAGIMIIVLQISSRFFTIRLSKTMESYLKYTFSRQVLIFAIAWMGTRDIYIALIITLLFTFAADCLFNEDCRFCILPDSFKEYHMKLAEELHSYLREKVKKQALKLGRDQTPQFKGDKNKVLVRLN